MTDAAKNISKMALALVLGISLAMPAFAQNENSSPVGPSQQEMASLMEMARQMMGMLPQMMRMLESLGKEFNRISMESYESLDLTDKQRTQVMQIQQDYRQTQAELTAREKEESVRLQHLLEAERPDPALVAEQQMRVDGVRRQMLVSRIDARNRLYDVLTEKQRQQLRRNEPQLLKDVYPSP